MPVNIHISGEHAHEALNELAALASGLINPRAAEPAPAVSAEAAPQHTIEAAPKTQNEAPAAEAPKRSRGAKKSDPVVAAAAETKQDDAATQAQDAADEQAEAEGEGVDASATRDDVRNALGAYVEAYGMDAAQEDGPRVLKLVFGNAVDKISAIPDEPAAFAKAVAGVNEMLEKNPFNRKRVS